MTIDLNCDLGENFGIYRLFNDEALMPYISSANVACGFHAGDFSTMRETVRLCVKQGVSVGAHPSFPDLQGFGRREMRFSRAEIQDMLLYQIGALKIMCDTEGVVLRHVKPHGALYNMAAKDLGLATTIAETIFLIDKSLILMGLAQSLMAEAAQKIGVRFAAEGFADRSYQQDGTLTPRHLPDALIENEQLATAQALGFVFEKKVKTRSGSIIPMSVDTICVHGDGKNALNFVKILRGGFAENGVEVQPPNPQRGNYS